MHRRKLGALMFSTLLASTQPVRADNLEKGFLAFNEGRHATAIEYLTPLAEGSERQAQFLLSVIYQSDKSRYQDEYLAFE
ncbi:hypothetical protein BOW51_00355 [Solemya velesiana gill symbiont]|uniref:Outer membrane lipoprotein BamD-like domain-containing protein n=2 Tax=Solemya velesiana gill symbiont TaxID=1918948 RepID=A0A1T2KYI4_9GAMM|nr:hypothetical protein BOW51_00355 [Solemya velesiana gill symbiont]